MRMLQQEIKSGDEKKRYKRKDFTMKVLTFMFGKSYCSERCRNSSENKNEEEGK
jgi:hypothetical protein